MASLLSKSASRGDPLEAARKDLARKLRDRESAEARVSAAEAAAQDALATGAGDDEADAAELALKKARRDVARLSIEIAGLRTEIEGLAAVSRVARERELVAAVVAAGEAHGLAARAAHKSAVAYFAAVNQVLAEGFARAAIEIPPAPPTVYSLAGANGPGFGNDLGIHEPLEKFDWSISQLKRKLEAMS